MSCLRAFRTNFEYLEAVRVLAVYFQRLKIFGFSVSNGIAVHRALLSLPQPLSQVAIVVCYRSGQLCQLEGDNIIWI